MIKIYKAEVKFGSHDEPVNEIHLFNVVDEDAARDVMKCIEKASVNSEYHTSFFGVCENNETIGADW